MYLYDVIAKRKKKYESKWEVIFSLIQMFTYKEKGYIYTLQEANHWSKWWQAGIIYSHLSIM